MDAVVPAESSTEPINIHQLTRSSAVKRAVDRQAKRMSEGDFVHTDQGKTPDESSSPLSSISSFSDIFESHVADLTPLDTAVDSPAPVRKIFINLRIPKLDQTVGIDLTDPLMKTASPRESPLRQLRGRTIWPSATEDISAGTGCVPHQRLPSECRHGDKSSVAQKNSGRMGAAPDVPSVASSAGVVMVMDSPEKAKSPAENGKSGNKGRSIVS